MVVRIFGGVSPLVLIFGFIHHVQGGICWADMNENGRCTDIISLHLTREQCCQYFSDVTTAWSATDLDSSSLFFLRALGGGVPCIPCKESCLGVQCSSGKKCVLRDGHPKCICAPVCKKNRRTRGPVCGTDTRSYRNVCRLRKRACRQRNTSLKVEYRGFCQSSCDKVECSSGKYCLVDQNLLPHCVQCSRCGSDSPNSPVCGVDGVTYPNTCLLRQTACRRGKAIPIAYKGKCKDLAHCGSVRCSEGQSCLLDQQTGRPRCVTCSRSNCSRGIGKYDGGAICGTNNRTYVSWCHMMRDACATGYVIETAFTGKCNFSHSMPSSFYPPEVVPVGV